MKYSQFDSTSITVSRLSVGTATFGKQTQEPAAHEILSKATDAGVDFIDTDDGYPINCASPERMLRPESLGALHTRLDIQDARRCTVARGFHRSAISCSRNLARGRPTVGHWPAPAVGEAVTRKAVGRRASVLSTSPPVAFPCFHGNVSSMPVTDLGRLTKYRSEMTQGGGRWRRDT